MLSKLVEKGPGQTIEFMPTLDESQLAEVLVAFANSDGGTVLMGVYKNGDIDPSVMREDVEDALRLALGQCSPGVRTEWQRSEVRGGEVIAIHVPRSNELHSFRNDSSLKHDLVCGVTEQNHRLDGQVDKFALAELVH